MGSDPTITIAERSEALRSALRPGTRIDRYVLVEPLGAGGMGVVWEALDPELDRRVAIKVLRSASRPDRRERLLREAQAMAKLAHPAVVPVFDAGADGEQVFIAMELVDGDTLGSVLRERSHGWREVLAMFAHAGRGLAAAHEAGIIHRDFKPENVLVGRDGRARVTDFGLARFDALDGEATSPGSDDEAGEAGEAGSPPALTSPGAVMGTPRYMAPEQHRGEPTSAATDQFGYCVALWEAIHGAPPFATGEATVEEISEAVIAGRLQPPPASSPVPARIHKILARGLALPPAERWPSMTALIDALEEVPRRRRRLAYRAAAAVGGVSVLGVLALLLVPRGQDGAAAPCQTIEQRLAGAWDPEVRGRAERGFTATAAALAPATWTRVSARLDDYAKRWGNRARATCEATFVTRDQSEPDHALRERCLEGRLQSLRALVTTLAHPDRTAVEHSIDAAAALPDPAICDDVVALRAQPLPPTDAAQQRRASELGMELARIDAAEALGAFDRALELARHAAIAAGALGYPPHEARALFQVGMLEYNVGHGEPASHLERAALLAEAARDDVLRFKIFDQLVRVEVMAGTFERARWSSRQARGVIARIGFQPRFEAAIRLSEAELAWADGAIQRAVELREEALTWLQRMEPPDELIGGRVHLDLGNAYQRVRRFDDARAQLALARAAFKHALGPDHPSLAAIDVSEGGLYFMQERYDDARAAYERAIAHFDRTRGPDSADALPIRFNLGLVYSELDRPADAARIFEAGLPIAIRQKGATHPDVASWLSSLGDVSLDRGDAKQARAYAERAIEILSRSDLPRTDLEAARYLLGQALWKEGGDRARARTILREARATFVAAGEGHKHTVEAIDEWMKQNGVR